MREQRQRMWLQWRRIEKRIRAKDDLYDVSMLRGYGCKNDGYGELLPNFSKQLAEVLQLTASHKVLDVGSGIGFLCFDLACLSGCNVKGIEIRRDIYLKSVQIAKHVAQRMRLEVQFVYGDATGDSFHFNNMDVIVCCNTLWSDENNYRLLQKLCVQMRPGTRVVVLEQLGGQRYHEKSARHHNDILSSCFHLPPQKFYSEPGSVSWTSNSIPFYIYTKKKISRDMKERMERERVHVLNAPKHRTDPRVVSFRGKKRAEVMDDVDDAQDLAEMDVPAPKRLRGENGKSAAPGKRVTRSTKASEDSKDSKDTKPKKPRRRMHRPRLTMRKRRVNANPKVRSKARSQGQKQEKRKQPKKQEQEQEVQEEDESEKEASETEEQATPRQTRAQARARLSSPPLFPIPEESSTPKTRSRTANPSASSSSSSSSASTSKKPPSRSLPPSKAAKQNFGKTTTRPTIKPLTNVTKVSERKSQRFKKFNMKLNDYIA